MQTEVLEQRMIVADEEVASKLKVPCGDEVIKIVRLRYVKDSFHEGPIVYNISYFPKKFSFLLKCNFEEESDGSIDTESCGTPSSGKEY